MKRDESELNQIDSNAWLDTQLENFKTRNSSQKSTLAKNINFFLKLKKNQKIIQKLNKNYKSLKNKLR